MDSSAALETFRGLVLRHRGRTGLTQREFAERVGVHRRSLQEWEAGVTYPTPDRLQALIAALLDSGGFTVGRESSEVRDVWAAAEREAPRMHTPFDQEWFARLLAERAGTIPAAPTSERREDCCEAPDVRGFVGRTQELAQLYRCVVEERRQVVTVLGMGGIGKTSLAAKLGQDCFQHGQQASDPLSPYCQVPHRLELLPTSRVGGMAQPSRPGLFGRGPA